MSIQSLNTNGLGLRFRVEGQQVIFLTEDGEPKATRPATPAELILWGELNARMSETEQARTLLQKAEGDIQKTGKETLKLTRALQRFSWVTTEQLQDPVGAAVDQLKEQDRLREEVRSFGEWLDREFPGELNDTEGILGTAARLLRGRRGQGTPKQAKQVGGMAVREAQRASLSPEDAALAKPIVQEGP